MRELGRVEGTPGKDMQLTLDLGLQAYAMKRHGRAERGGRGHRRAQRRHPRPRLGAGLRSQQLRLRHPLGRVERAPQRRVPPARQQDRHRHLPARLDLQDRHGARGARRRRRQPRRRRRLRRRHLSRRPPLPLLEEAAATAGSSCARASLSPATATTTRWAAASAPTGSARWRRCSGSASATTCRCRRCRKATCPTPSGRRRTAARAGPPATASTTASARASPSPRRCSSR